MWYLVRAATVAQALREQLLYNASILYHWRCCRLCLPAFLTKVRAVVRIHPTGTISHIATGEALPHDAQHAVSTGLQFTSEYRSFDR